MKRDNILKTVAGCIALLCYSCNENDIIDQTNGAYDDNRIRFHVTTGPTVEADSRSLSTAADDTTNLLNPLVLKSPECEQTLYLHTYVADESERSSESISSSRAAQVNGINDFLKQNKTNGFYVSSSSFITPFQTATPVGESQTIWTTQKAYYWPNNDKNYVFSAYAPESAKNLLEKSLKVEDEQISFDYTVPKSETTDQDATVQPDLMFAVKNCNRASSEKGNVPLNFRHALSAIKFAVRDVVDGTIESISISGVYGSGSCVYQKETTNTETTEQETTTEENYGFKWTVNTSAEKCAYTQKFDYEIKNAPTTSPTDGGESKDIVLNDKNPEMTFMLIPQEIPNDAKITVVFKRNDNQEFKLTGKIKDNDVTQWESGKEYVYTISTNSANWIYVFDVTGCVQGINDDEPEKGEFKDDDNSIIVNQTVTEGAYYQVKSYKYRANNLKITQAVNWQISDITNGETTLPDDLKNYETKIDDTSIEANKWMPTKTNEDKGSTAFKKYDIEFYPQMTGTDWSGDWELRARDENGKENEPVDLSMVKDNMNTANCYVVNAPGYYKFPLVYGNAIKGGSTNSASYTYKNASTNYSNKDIYPALNNFTDYKGNVIKNPKIEGANDAILVWQDAYNLISDVKLEKGSGGYDYVSFKVNQDQLQQGNAVLAIRDNNGTIMWSWHIWITEHWTLKENLKIGVGDVDVNAYDSNYNGFTVAPYSLGWCDPKNVWYLKRTGKMTFVQAESNNEKSLEVEQREKKIEYWIGNNVYYQFGRKDPMVGFMNDNSVVKYNFGNLPYRIEAQTKTIEYGIQHPNVLFAGADVKLAQSSYLNYNDWLSTSYYNLWNNTLKDLPSKMPSTEIANYHYSGIKTVYDPCPADYQVPPVGFFKIITNGGSNSDEGKEDYKTLFKINGKYSTESNNVYLYQVNAKEQGKYVNFHATGHRWYAENYKGLENYKGGNNFNPKIVYLWSNQIYFHEKNKSAYGLALGLNDEKQEYASDFQFIGRRAMARPVRPVKEFTEKSNK